MNFFLSPSRGARKTENIFISENIKAADFEEEIAEINARLDKETHTAIFSKIYNNRIGYYLFKRGEKTYKVYVLPKHIPVPSHEEEVIPTIEMFIDYLILYQRLRQRYKAYNAKEQTVSSYLDFSYASDTEEEGGQDIEKFIFTKYSSILKDIQEFFRRHKSRRRIKREYVSQTVKHKINLARNIREIDKTKIHQDKFEDIAYSQIATITFSALALFERTKLQLLDERHQARILSRTIDIRFFLKKRYQVDSGYKLTLSRLLSSKIKKYFYKKEEYRHLYQRLLYLFGIENFFDESLHRQTRNDLKSESFFFSPETMYEWYVYDLLKKYVHAFNMSVGKKQLSLYFDNKNETGKEYTIFLNEDIKTRRSKPDIIIRDETTKRLYIVDAKWKILDGVPGLNDVFKLQRDCWHHKEDFTVYALLIYAHIDNAQHLVCKEPACGNDGNPFVYHAIKLPYDLPDHTLLLRDTIEKIHANMAMPGAVLGG